MHSLFSLIAAISAIIVICGCQKATSPQPKTAHGLSWTIQELISSAREASLAAEAAEKRSDMKDHAERGMAHAQECLERAPEEPACYYWRAVATGLYYEATVIGYQEGVKQMIADCMRVMQLDPRYEYAGSYRILGQLYTKLPQTGVHPSDVVRDLTRAESYLREAVRLAPQYPENHLTLAETLLAQEKVLEAIDALTRAKELVPQWKRSHSYGAWQASAKELEQKIARRAN